MNYYKKIFILLILFIFHENIYSQNKIFGKIYDAETKEVLVGANVYFPDLHKGSITNDLGEFQLDNISSGKFDLFVSFISYQNKLLKLQTDTCKNKLIIYLKPEAFQSQEIIVSGSRFSLQHENAIEVKSLKLLPQEQNQVNFINKIAEIPGVDVISKGAGLAKPVIRGLSNTNILFIDNGVRMENFQFSKDHPFMSDEFGVERVEVIKGAASLLYGSDAVGGVIFSVREKPPHGKKLAGDYLLQYFGNSQGVHSSLGLQSAQNYTHFGIRASLKSHKDYYDGNNNQVPNTRFEQKSLKTMFGYSFEKGKVDFYYDYSQMQIGLCIAPSIALISNNKRSNEIWYQKLSNHVFVVKNKLFINDIKLDINASFQSNNRTLLTSDLTPAFKMVDMLLNTFALEVKSTYSLKKNELIIGSQNSFQTNKNFDAPDHVIPDAQVISTSVFSLLSRNFNDNFHFQAGIRFDYKNLQTEKNTANFIEKNYQDISFSSGFTYQISENLLLRTNLASGYRSPNIAEITQDGMHGEYYEKGNPELESQRNYEPDISLHFHAKKFIFEISSFYNEIENYIFLGKTKQTTDNGVLIYQYTQSNANILGFETGFKIMPFNFLKFQSNYAYVLAKQENGDYLPFIPQNKIKSKFNLKFKKLFFAENPYLLLKFVYAFRKKNIPASETETPEYFTTDLSLGFEKEIKQYRFYFSTGINNLFNEKYIDHLSTLKGLDYYQTGRDFYLSAKLKF